MHGSQNRGESDCSWRRSDSLRRCWLFAVLPIAIHYNFGPFHDVSMGGRHIHHLVWGILLLLLSGYGWLLEVGTGTQVRLRWLGRLMSMIYGVAAALTLDEFALWLNLRDVYWEREGRESFEALALFGGLLAIGLFGRPFFHGIVSSASPGKVTK